MEVFLGSGLDEFKKVLLSYHTIIFVGCSRHPGKPAHDVPEEMKKHGYNVVCVNPAARRKILGSPTFPDLKSVPKKYLEIVDIFRPSQEVPGIVDRMIRFGILPKVFWMQEGIRNEYARKKLEPLGVKVIEDRCILKTYLALLSERDEVYGKILAFARTYARARGFALNPDPEIPRSSTRSSWPWHTTRRDTATGTVRVGRSRGTSRRTRRRSAPASGTRRRSGETATAGAASSGIRKGFNGV